MSTSKITQELINLDKNLSDYPQQRMRLMVKYLQEFMITYDKQHYYEDYSDRTLVDDVLYGLGVALNPFEHQFADGFDKWEQKLAEFLNDPDSLDS